MLYLEEITRNTAEYILRFVAIGEGEITTCSFGGDVYAALAITMLSKTTTSPPSLLASFVQSCPGLPGDMRPATKNTRFMTHPVKVEFEDTTVSAVSGGLSRTGWR